MLLSGKPDFGSWGKGQEIKQTFRSRSSAEENIGGLPTAVDWQPSIVYYTSVDYLSHGLWGITFVRRGDLPALTVLAASLPDLLGQSWTIFSRLRQSRRLGIRKALDMSIVFSEMELVTYRFFHSFCAWGIFTAALYLFFRGYMVLSLAYLSHILVDIPVHQGIWATRIFYPFSDFHFEGRNWWQSKRVVLASCGLLLLVNLVLVAF